MGATLANMLFSWSTFFIFLTGVNNNLAFSGSVKASAKTSLIACFCVFCSASYTGNAIFPPGIVFKALFPNLPTGPVSSASSVVSD